LIKAQAANTVVQSPSLLPMADWVMFERADDLAGHLEEIFPFVPGGVGIEFNAQSGGQHARR
jgi:hypothetical protein